MDVTTVVDTDGEPLRHAVRAEPDVVSPNVLEAEELVGHEFNDEEDRSLAVREMVAARRARGDHDAARRLRRPGARRRRRRRCTACGSSRARPSPTVGSGDAFLAGYVAARYAGAPPEECLRFGVACGAESTQRLGAGLIDPREVERLLGEIDVQRSSARRRRLSPASARLRPSRRCYLEA